MNQLNLCIKSVADNAFLIDHNNVLKEKALMKLFDVFRGNMGDTFSRWRENCRLLQLQKRANQ